MPNDERSQADLYEYPRGEQTKRYTQMTCGGCGTSFYVANWLVAIAKNMRLLNGPFCSNCRSNSARTGGSGRVFTK